MITSIILSIAIMLNPDGTIQQLSLQNSYDAEREHILSECGERAVYYVKLTEQRDAGVPYEAVRNFILDEAVRQNKESKIETRDVLYHIMFARLIYNSPLDKEKIFNASVRSCAKEPLEILDAVYKHLMETTE